jgi:acylpyruvate hydrolase
VKVVIYGAARRVGAVVGTDVVDLNWTYAKYLREVRGVPRAYAHADAMVPASLAGFIEEGRPALDAACLALDYQASRNPDPVGAQDEQIVHPAGVKIHAPLPSPAARLAMAGGNYPEHLRGYLARKMRTQLTPAQAYEQTRAKGAWGFWKMPGTVAGPDEPVVYPARARYLDYEGEVAIVLGKAGHDIPESRAAEHIWGYTLVNDWTIFGEHEQQRALSLNLAKNYDTSCSLGPAIVVDELDDAQNVDVETRVNGELRQKGNTGEMAYSFAEYIAYLSRDLTLRPGDLISGGSPAGTAGDSSDYDADGVPSGERFIHIGDEVEVSSPRIGVLRNRVHGRGQT